MTQLPQYRTRDFLVTQEKYGETRDHAYIRSDLEGAKRTALTLFFDNCPYGDIGQIRIRDEWGNLVSTYTADLDTWEDRK